jgi:hypothetical protein
MAENGGRMWECLMKHVLNSGPKLFRKISKRLKFKLYLSSKKSEITWLLIYIYLLLFLLIKKMLTKHYVK